MNRSITAIIKPTHECNLACKYCYVEESAEQGRMNHKTLGATVEKLMTLQDRNRVHFIWHGGEPLLMGIDFYREALRMQQQFKKGKWVVNGFQSNCTLVNEKVLDFCEQNGFDIGSSVDGPEGIHNLTRIYSDGRGSFQEVLAGINKIKDRNAEIKKRTPPNQKAHYLGGGAIVILSRHNIDKVDEIYDFFKAQGMSIKINPLIRSGRARVGYEDLSIGPAEYGRALVHLFDRWFYEPERGIDVDPLSTILGNLMTRKPVGCNFQQSCRDGFVSIGPQGDIYPCGRFDGLLEYRLGNINEDDLSEMIGRRQEKLTGRTAETVRGCSWCNFSDICNAGCMHNAYMVRGDINDKDYYCASYKILFEHLGKALNEELKKAEVDEIP